MLEQQLRSLPFLTHHEDVKTLCQPLFKLGISSYVYLRTYADGTQFRLGNRSDWLMHYYAQGLYKESVLEKVPQYYQPGAVLWSTLSSHSTVLDSAKNDFNITHGMTLFYKEDDYCEKFFFGSEATSPEIINLYLNDLAILHNFNRYFKDQAAPIIKKADAGRFYLPLNEDLSTIQQYDLSIINRVAQQSSDLNIVLVQPYRLSKREQQIADFLMKGYTAVQIAEKLFLSRRTIEAHTAHIKEKLQVRNKAQLISTLLSAHK